MTLQLLISRKSNMLNKLGLPLSFLSLHNVTDEELGFVIEKVSSFPFSWCLLVHELLVLLQCLVFTVLLATCLFCKG